MTKLYELPNGRRFITDIDKSTKICNVTEPQLDILISDLNRYAEMKVEADENIKLLGEEHRKFREGITDEKVLIGYNMAIAICNKYFAESEDKE